MSTKIRSPAARAFDVVVVGVGEPYSKASLAGLLSDVVVDVIVDRNLSLRDRPDVPWKGRGVFVILLRCSDTTTPLVIVVLKQNFAAV
jgi:hypothetical protein